MIGKDAGYKGGTGTTAVGYDALSRSSLSAAYLTAVGSAALKNNTTGTNNTALGTDALLDNTTGAGNTGVGKDAGISLSTGSNNTFLGYQAGNSNTIGNSNTYIGNLAGNTTTSGGNNTLLGYDAEASSATVSNEITLGNTAVTKFRIPGINFVIKDTTATEDYVLTVDASGEAGWEAVAGGAVIKTVGKESIWVPAGAIYPSTTNPCSDLAQVETTALRPDLKVLDFATGADEFAQFTVAFPKSWNKGTVTFQPFWTVTGTNTGTVAWSLSGIAVSSDDSINVAFGTAAVTTALAHSGTSNDLMVSAESGAITIAGTPAAADCCFFQISRDVSADTQSGDARLIGIKLFFTTDAANDA
jgi:hypothetical protein